MVRFLIAAALLVVAVFIGTVFFQAMPLDRSYNVNVLRADFFASQKDGVVARDFFEKYYESAGPTLLLDLLEEQGYCHAEAHNLGRVIYEKTRKVSAAASQCASRCTGGCLHGVIAQMVEEESGFVLEDEHTYFTLETIPPSIRDLVVSTCKGEDVNAYTGMGNCYHGAGHALYALAGGNTEEAVRMCDIFREEGDGPLFYCASGVYMEHSIALGQNGAVAADTCKVARYPTACFRYVIGEAFDARRDPSSAREYCAALPASTQRSCMHGLGWSAYMLVERDPSVVNDVCIADAPGAFEMCVAGVVERVNLTEKPTFDFCSVLATPTVACDDPTSISPKNLERDFSLYMK